MSFAIMYVNAEYKVDQFDHFVPFAKETLLRSGVDAISANELRDNINEYFKISLPISVINTILRRKLYKKGYVKKENNIFVPNYEKLKDSNFQEIKQRIMERHEKLINDIVKFGHDSFTIALKEHDVEKALELFLDKNQLALLDTSLNPSRRLNQLHTQTIKDNQLEYIISKFIEHAFNQSSVSFNYIIDIVKGTMLTNALYFRDDITTINMKFKGTEVFFDSSFLIYALGYAGSARQEPCIELIDMLRSNNAILRVFQHNIDEMIGILEFCKMNLRKGVYDPHGTISNFLEKNYSEIDIDRIIYSMQEELENRFRIKVVETVEFNNYANVISHEDLYEKLKKNLSYRNESAIETDVDSVSAIVRLRKSNKSKYVERSRALFVTNNFNFAKTIRKYFNKDSKSKFIPPVIHDTILTNIMWLKNPSQTPDLPRKRIIAQTFAATQPDEHLWSRYLTTVKKYEDEFTQDEFVFLYYSRSAKEMLMDLTMGDETILSIGTIREIIAERDRRKQQEILNIKKQEEEKRSIVEKELASAMEQQAATSSFQHKRAIQIARKRAKCVTNSIIILISLIIMIVMYASMFDGFKARHPVITSIIFLFVVLLNVLGILGVNAIPYKKKLENYLKKYFENKIKNTYYQ